MKKKMYSIDPITRSFTVSKKRKGAWMTYEKGVVEFYKNDRKVLSMDITQLDEFLLKVEAVEIDEF